MSKHQRDPIPIKSEEMGRTELLPVASPRGLLETQYLGTELVLESKKLGTN